MPPHKLKAMQEALLANKSSADEAYQKLQWEALRKSINGLVNKGTPRTPHILCCSESE